MFPEARSTSQRRVYFIMGAALRGTFTTYKTIAHKKMPSGSQNIFGSLTSRHVAFPITNKIPDMTTHVLNGEADWFR